MAPLRRHAETSARRHGTRRQRADRPRASGCDRPRARRGDRPSAPRRDRGFIAALAAGLVAYNSLLNARPPPTRAYVPANLTTAAGLILAARRRGLSWAELGLLPGSPHLGLRLGATVAGVAGAGLAAAVSWPPARRLLRDRRVEGIGAGELLTRMVVRIPLGTVALEEAAFRGVLLAAWTRASPRAAVMGSSAVFGLWHVAPTLQLLRVNAPQAGVVQRLTAVLAGTAVSAAGGAGLCVLRAHGGLVAPALAHAAVNALATAAAFAAHRLGPSDGLVDANLARRPQFDKARICGRSPAGA